MPYTSTTAKLEGTDYDARRKLTDEEKKQIKELYQPNVYGYQRLANRFGVSKRTIMYIIKPELLAKVRLRLKERGGWKKYYTKEKNREYQKRHRRRKHELYKEGRIR